MCAALKRRLARGISVGEDRGVNVHDDLVALSRRARVELVVERGLGEQRQIRAQVIAEEVDASMLADVTAARDVRGDQDAVVVPEPTIGLVGIMTSGARLSGRGGSEASA